MCCLSVGYGVLIVCFFWCEYGYVINVTHFNWLSIDKLTHLILIC